MRCAATFWLRRAAKSHVCCGATALDERRRHSQRRLRILTLLRRYLYPQVQPALLPVHEL
jgi:hypothetical protein